MIRASRLTTWGCVPVPWYDKRFTVYVGRLHNSPIRFSQPQMRWQPHVDPYGSNLGLTSDRERERKSDYIRAA
jgi:hypothetical protein